MTPAPSGTDARLTGEGTIPVPGGSVRYWIYGQRGIPLLCLHGGPGMAHDYLDSLADLADRRTVIFYDQLGCGASDRPDDPSLWTLERSVAEVAAVCEALGLGRIHLFGNSWGGWLALQYTLDRRPDLASLTISSSPPSVPRVVAEMGILRGQLPEDVERVIADHEARREFDCPEYSAAILVFYKRHLCRLDRPQRGRTSPAGDHGHFSHDVARADGAHDELAMLGSSQRLQSAREHDEHLVGFVALLDKDVTDSERAPGRRRGEVAEQCLAVVQVPPRVAHDVLDSSAASRSGPIRCYSSR